MSLDRSELLLAWFAGGFVLFLLWAALLGQTLLSARRRAVRPALGLLLVLGVVHPVAAISAADLSRLVRSLDEPDLSVPAWLPAASIVVVGVSLLVALALWTAAGAS